MPPLSSLAAALMLLSIAPLVSAEVPQRLTWKELPCLLGKRVNIAMYNGGAVSGVVRQVQPDALLVDVSRSTSPVTLPKGPLLVPRDKLFVLDVYVKGSRFRLIGTAIGFVASAAGYDPVSADDRRTTTVQIIH